MTDTKQAVKALREALKHAEPAPWGVAPDGCHVYNQGGQSVAETLLFDDATFIAAARNHLPPILDRLEELEREKADLQSRYDRRINSHDKDGRALMRIAAERDAIRAKFAEFREAARELLKTVYVGDGKVVCPPAILPHVRQLTDLLTRFPALDSSETTKDPDNG